MSSELPDWADLSEKKQNGGRLTALETFIYEQEPAGEIAEVFRSQLAAAIAEQKQPTVETSAESCMHKWTVLGAPRNPDPDQVCEGGCARTYADVTAENR